MQKLSLEFKQLFSPSENHKENSGKVATPSAVVPQRKDT